MRTLMTAWAGARAAGRAPDPELQAWRRHRSHGRRLRRRARLTGAAAVAAAAAVVPSAGLTELAAGASAAGLGLAAAAVAARARRLNRSLAGPPPALPAPGTPGFSYVARLSAAVASLHTLLGSPAGVDLSESAAVLRSVDQAAGVLRDVARRLAAAQQLHDSLGDPNARAALDRNLSELTADLSDGVIRLERVVAAAAETVAIAQREGSAATTRQLDQALSDLVTRSAGLKVAHRTGFPELDSPS